MKAKNKFIWHGICTVYFFKGTNEQMG